MKSFHRQAVFYFIDKYTAHKKKENDWRLLRYFFLLLVLPFMVALSFYGISRKWEE